MLGDTKALHLLHIHNALTRNALRDHRGREVKHTGDGIMASFDSVLDVVECAIIIQNAFAAHNQAEHDAAMHLRIGISAGEPIENTTTCLAGPSNWRRAFVACGTRLDFSGWGGKDLYPAGQSFSI